MACELCEGNLFGTDCNKGNAHVQTIGHDVMSIVWIYLIPFIHITFNTLILVAQNSTIYLHRCVSYSAPLIKTSAEFWLYQLFLVHYTLHDGLTLQVVVGVEFST